MITDIFITLSILFYLIGIIPYLYHTFHGRVIPHPFSWTVWAILAFVNTLALFYQVGFDFLLLAPAISSIALCFWAVIWWFMVKNIQITYLDYIFLFLGVAVIGFAYFKWLYSAIIPSICVDLLILAPTLRKLWDNPRSEDLIGWLGAGISKLFFILSLGMGAFSFSNTWWWYTFIVNMLVALVIFYRTRYTETWLYMFKKVFSIFALKKKLW